MSNDVRGAELLALIIADGVLIRAAHYREEAEKFRQMAEGERDERLRGKLTNIAMQYAELAESLISKSGHVTA